MADDLDDAWWEKQENETIAGLESESSDDQEDNSTEREITSTKRKSVSEEDGEPPQKKKKKKKRKRITDEIKQGSMKRGSPEDFVQIIQKHFAGKLSAVESDELQVDTDIDFFPSSESDHTPTSYFRSILPKWSKHLKMEVKPGHPLVLVISSSAIRAVELNRELKDFKTDKCKCAKLFAKHFKLEDQQKYLGKTPCHLGIGTPNRILALLKLNALHLDDIKAVVLDYNWRDVKAKKIIDIPDVKKDLLNLMKEYLLPHIHNTKCKIAIL